jgi:hypothetical protein
LVARGGVEVVTGHHLPPYPHQFSQRKNRLEMG